MSCSVPPWTTHWSLILGGSEKVLHLHGHVLKTQLLTLELQKGWRTDVMLAAMWVPNNLLQRASCDTCMLGKTMTYVVITSD
jgi:hypothetical protein